MAAEAAPPLPVLDGSAGTLRELMRAVAAAAADEAAAPAAPLGAAGARPPGPDEGGFTPVLGRRRKGARGAVSGRGGGRKPAVAAASSSAWLPLAHALVVLGCGIRDAVLPEGVQLGPSTLGGADALARVVLRTKRSTRLEALQRVCVADLDGAVLLLRLDGLLARQESSGATSRQWVLAHASLPTPVVATGDERERHERMLRSFMASLARCAARQLEAEGEGADTARAVRTADVLSDSGLADGCLVAACGALLGYPVVYSTLPPSTCAVAKCEAGAAESEGSRFRHRPNCLSEVPLRLFTVMVRGPRAASQHAAQASAAARSLAASTGAADARRDEPLLGFSIPEELFAEAHATSHEHDRGGASDPHDSTGVETAVALFTADLRRRLARQRVFDAAAVEVRVSAVTLPVVAL